MLRIVLTAQASPAAPWRQYENEIAGCIYWAKSQRKWLTNSVGNRRRNSKKVSGNVHQALSEANAEEQCDSSCGSQQDYFRACGTKGSTTEQFECSVVK